MAHHLSSASRCQPSALMGLPRKTRVLCSISLVLPSTSQALPSTAMVLNSATQGLPNTAMFLSRKSEDLPSPSIVGWRIQHIWKTKSRARLMTGIVLCQVAIIPSLYLVKYDGVDYIKAMELYEDERIKELMLLHQKCGKRSVADISVAANLVHKVVKHRFQTGGGRFKEWTGMVVGQSNVMPDWFYIIYQGDPVCYMYQLVDDFKAGDLQIVANSDSQEPREVRESRVGSEVILKKAGREKKGIIFHQLNTISLIKFEGEYLVYAYNLVDNHTW